MYRLAPPQQPVLRIGGKNYCLTCPHFNREKCVKLPYEYCRITRST
ncbi:MAG: hypothetical protein IKR30_03800 [Bacteroidales bacterium]|nr:hypothetical protein [Bacteroidales bacterium]